MLFVFCNGQRLGYLRSGEIMEDKSIILVVDDDLDELLLLSQAFKDIGHGDPVLYAGSGQLMFDVLERTKPNLYGLIILDMNMPGQDGMEVLKKLKAHPEYSGIPVVIYTTSSNEEEKDFCMQSGAIDFITKPDSLKGHIAACTRFSFLLKLANL